MRASPFSVPLVRPLETATGTIERREGVLVRVGDGPEGLGEAAPLAGWTEPLEACRSVLEDLTTADDCPETADDLGRMPNTPAARHAVELALLDREARRADEPLYRRLGGGHRASSLPVNVTVADADADETVETAAAAVEEGFRTVKLKVGSRRLEEDLERVSRVREEVGHAVALRVDANGAWGRDEAERAVETLASLDVELVEQPVTADDLDGASVLRGRGVDIGLDESVRAHGVTPVVEADAADVLVLKPMALGGVGRATDAATAVREAGLDLVVTTTIDAVVARTAAVHLAAALDPTRACGLATASWLARDLAVDPAPVVDGAVTVPQSAGHGVRVEDLA